MVSPASEAQEAWNQLEEQFREGRRVNWIPSLWGQQSSPLKLCEISQTKDSESYVPTSPTPKDESGGTPMMGNMPDKPGVYVTIPPEFSNKPAPESDSKQAFWKVLPAATNDVVSKPRHYQITEDWEALDVIKEALTEEEFRGYCKGNFLKYRLRLGDKDSVEQDLDKSNKYRNLLNGVRPDGRLLNPGSDA